MQRGRWVWVVAATTTPTESFIQVGEDLIAISLLREQLPHALQQRHSVSFSVNIFGKEKHPTPISTLSGLQHPLQLSPQSSHFSRRVVSLQPKSDLDNSPCETLVSSSKRSLTTGFGSDPSTQGSSSYDLQDSCLKNPIGRNFLRMAFWKMVLAARSVAKSLWFLMFLTMLISITTLKALSARQWQCYLELLRSFNLPKPWKVWISMKFLPKGKETLCDDFSTAL